MQKTNGFDSLLGSDNRVSIGEMLQEGWAIFKQNMVGFVVYSFIVLMLISLAAFTIIGALLISLPLICGFYLMAEKIAKAESEGFMHFFGGFRHFFSLLIYLVILTVVFGIASYLYLYFYPISFDENAISWDNPVVMIVQIAWQLVLALGSLIFLLIPLIYFSIAFALSPLLIIFESYSAWEAMKMSWKLVHKHWFTMMFAHILLGIVALSGTIALSVGVIVTLPIAYCMHYALYRQAVPIAA